MLSQESILGILQCPRCGDRVDEELRCTGCNKKYTSREGVHILIDKKASRIEWTWDRRILAKKYRDEIRKGYIKLLSDEIRHAQEEWWNAVIPKIDQISGTVVDMATGLGIMLEKLLSRPIDMAIATDIDPNVLLSTKREFDKIIEKKAFYLATDVKRIALKDEMCDFVTSFAGTNNITDTAEVVREMHRILKPGGKAIIMSSFVDEDTPTAELAEEYGLLESFLRDRFLNILDSTGFKEIEMIEASSTIWEENKMDIFPIAGDRVYYAVLETRK